jgi:hypothetical protein
MQSFPKAYRRLLDSALKQQARSRTATSRQKYSDFGSGLARQLQQSPPIHFATDGIRQLR